MANAKNSKPKMIRVPLMVPGYSLRYTVSLYELEGPIEKVIAGLEAIRKQFPDKNLLLNSERVAYEDYNALHLYEERLETPEEVEARVKEDAEWDASRRKADLARLKELKKLYPDA